MSTQNVRISSSKFQEEGYVRSDRWQVHRLLCDGRASLRRSCVATFPLNVTTVARSPAQAFSKNSTDATLEENENVSTAPAAGKRSLPPVPMQRTAMNGGGGPQKSVLERLEELTKVFMDTGVVGYCREPRKCCILRCCGFSKLTVRSDRGRLAAQKIFQP